MVLIPDRACIHTYIHTGSGGAANSSSGGGAANSSSGAVNSSSSSLLCRHPTHLHGLYGVLTWMQPDTLPLVAYAYVCRLMYATMHDSLLLRACLFVPLPLLVCCAHQQYVRRVYLLHGSVPLLCVLQHGLVYCIHFLGSLHELVCAPCCQG
jgi:hypothetical protein